MYARHYPTQRFSKAEWDAMPVLDRDTGNLPPEGYSRILDDVGKAVVIHLFMGNHTISTFCIRPIIVVPAR